MRLKIIASALLISAAMGGAAFAQTTTVNGQTVTEIDLPRVQEYCNQLAASMMPDAMPTDSPESPTSTEAVGTTATTTTTTDSDSEPTIELGDITIEGCTEAGLLPAAAM